MLHKAASTLLSSPRTAPPAPTHTVDFTAVLVFATVFVFVFPSASVLKLSIYSAFFIYSYNGFAFVFIIVLVIGTYGNVHLTRKTRFSAPHLFSASHCKTLCDFKLSIFLRLLRLDLLGAPRTFHRFPPVGRIADVLYYFSFRAYCRYFHFTGFLQFNF